MCLTLPIVTVWLSLSSFILDVRSFIIVLCGAVIYSRAMSSRVIYSHVVWSTSCVLRFLLLLRGFPVFFPPCSASGQCEDTLL